MFELVKVQVSGKLKAFFNAPSVTGIVLYVYEHGCDVSFPLPQRKGTVTLYIANKELQSI